MTALIRNSAIYRFVIILYNSYLNSFLLKIPKNYNMSIVKDIAAWFMKVLRSSTVCRFLYPLVDINETWSRKSFLFRIFTYPFMIVIRLLQRWPGKLIARGIDNSRCLGVLSNNKKHFAANAVFYVGLSLFFLFGILTCLHYVLFYGLIDTKFCAYSALTAIGAMLMLASALKVKNAIRGSLTYRMVCGFFQIFWKE